jgi:glycosyltransferase involved in cell wall biosynthesis
MDEKAGREPEISIVVPLYNEEENIEELYRRLKEVLNMVGRTYELVFVDDGSRDKTAELLRQIFEKDQNVKVVRLRRNFGQTAALQAGFDFASGQIIISMDGDLQHDPADIPAFLAKLEEGFDIVSGWRKRRVDNLFLRRFPSWVANRIMRWLSGVPIHDFGTTFKAYRRDVVKGIQLYGELHRFIPALISRTGFKIVEIPIQNIVRQRGQSKYGLSRVRRVLFDLMTVKFIISFIDRPLQFFGLIGLIFGSLGGLIGLIIALGFYFFDWSIRNNIGNLILASLLIILGVQFVMTGLVAEIVSRIYFTTHRVKIYSVEKISSHDENETLR